LLAAHYRIPAIYYLPEFAEDGGLMAYGASAYEFVINFKAAKALDLTIPPSVISIADHVVE
jgi:hypothetical protein